MMSIAPRAVVLPLGIPNLLRKADQRTAGHGSRVAGLVERLCAALDLPSGQRADIVLAAGLHDVGKIGVDKSILHKQVRLEDWEWSCIKEHVGIGARILGTVGLERLIPMVASHHERFDGQGYPRGLRGDEIPLGGRLIAVADAYDAMRSPRVYSAAISQRQALTRLWAASGKQFDPRVVDTFCQMLAVKAQPEALRRAA